LAVVRIRGREMTTEYSSGQDDVQDDVRAARRGARRFPSAEQDSVHSRLDPNTPQTTSPAYRLGFADLDFILRDDLRAVRLQLEYLKPDLLQRDRSILATVAVFGSARIPAPDEAVARLEEAERALVEDPSDPKLVEELRIARSLADKCRYYDEARNLARLIAESHAVDSDSRPEMTTPPASEPEPGGATDACADTDPADTCKLYYGPGSVVVVTGGGPGIMEAANRGAHDAGGDSIGLNIVLPREQAPNPYITPHLCFNFHYYAMRKMHFLLRAVALVVFPGGYGTLDELFEVLTLIQTGKIEPIPVLLFGRDYWERIIHFEALAEEGMIESKDLEIFSYVETAEEAWEHLRPVLAAVREQT
jgi:hypothetical protein